MPTVEEYLSDWLKAEKPTVSEASYLKKDQTVRLFLESLGDRKRLSVEAITEADIVKLRDELLADGRRASTVRVRSSTPAKKLGIAAICAIVNLVNLGNTRSSEYVRNGAGI